MAGLRPLSDKRSILQNDKRSIQQNDHRRQRSRRRGAISTGAMVVIGLVVLLLILHQDNWFWNDGTLVFGFMPIGLLWHAGISLAAAATWFLATKIAWPLDDSEIRETHAKKPPLNHLASGDDHPSGENA